MFDEIDVDTVNNIFLYPIVPPTGTEKLCWDRIKKYCEEALKSTDTKQSTPIKCKCGGTLEQAVMCNNCYEATFGDGT